MSKNIDSANQVHYRSGIITPTTGDTILAAYDDRRTIIVQNLGTNPLFVKLGASATTSSFDLVLKAGTGADDGNGGTLSYDTLSYTGVISVAGVAPRCTITEI